MNNNKKQVEKVNPLATSKRPVKGGINHPLQTKKLNNNGTNNIQ